MAEAVIAALLRQATERLDRLRKVGVLLEPFQFYAALTVALLLIYTERHIEAW